MRGRDSDKVDVPTPPFPPISSATFIQLSSAAYAVQAVAEPACFMP